MLNYHFGPGIMDLGSEGDPVLWSFLHGTLGTPGVICIYIYYANVLQMLTHLRCDTAVLKPVAVLQTAKAFFRERTC
jgi:hypothetical protein